jgi:hypothetical protein
MRAMDDHDRQGPENCQPADKGAVGDGSSRLAFILVSD